MIKWFKKTPTQEGLYFARIPDGTHDLLVDASDIVIDPDGNPQLCFFFADHEIDPTAIAWWYGPIDKDS